MKSIEDIIQINKKQKEFYNTKKKNFATRIWSKIRHGLLADIRKQIGISNQVYETHKIWLGDLSDKKVLDLGCFSGNNLSTYMAKHAKSYIGLDLSDHGISILKKKLINFPNATAIAADFLDDSSFSEKEFDIIYAYGVLHHFQNVDVLINRLNDKLANNGFVISYDPLETNFFVKIFRVLYRPFQSDREWEWPFTRKTFFKFNEKFNITEKHGALGKTKWFFMLNLLPISKESKLKLGKEWHQEDWNSSSISNKKLLNCMHLTMKFYKK